jgi:flagellar biosynthesis protein FlhA
MIMRLDAATLFQPRILLALALMAVIVMMVLPVPAFLLDIGLAASFALAILIFTITLFIERPLDFAAFPSILLGSLMLRLSLNVSSTKLIIGQGHTGTDAAGHVIEGFAMFVMGGQLLVGIVVFLVLLIVNFVVINKGAARMAEVGARFALDAMPGKQMAIDADLAAGAITHAEARARRSGRARRRPSSARSTAPRSSSRATRSRACLSRRSTSSWASPWASSSTRCPSARPSRPTRS